MFTRVQCSLAVAFVATFVASAPAADWNQWRGPQSDGNAPHSPRLISKLPFLDWQRTL